MAGNMEVLMYHSINIIRGTRMQFIKRLILIILPFNIIEFVFSGVIVALLYLLTNSSGVLWGAAFGYAISVLMAASGVKPLYRLKLVKQ